MGVKKLQTEAECLAEKMKRNVAKDLRCLVEAFFVNIKRNVDTEYGGWGLDDKRPFGNSDVENDVLALIGAAPRTCPHCHETLPDDSGVDPRDYAAALYDELGTAIRDAWSATKRFV